MKRIKAKIAAITCAALASVCAAQSMTAFATVSHSSTMQEHVEGSANAVPFFQHFISHP